MAFTWISPFGTMVVPAFLVKVLTRCAHWENRVKLKTQLRCFPFGNVLSFSQYINILMTYPLSYLQPETWYSHVFYLTDSKFQITSCKLTSICSVLLMASCLLARLSNTQTLNNRGIYFHTWTSLKGHDSSSMWPAFSLHSKQKSKFKIV